MNKKEIEHIIQEPFFQKIIQERDFYFLKGQQALNHWLEMEISDQLRDELIRLSSDYTKFLKIAETNPEIKRIKDKLFEIIAYCDKRTKDKSYYNQYDDDRVLADASVRMGNWVDGLVKFKFEHAQITGKSILNAFNYLLSPKDNCTILSDNHRQMVSVNLLKKDYSPETFVDELKAFFDTYELKLQNQANYTYLISSLVYAFKTEWIDEVIGLMASDGTGWQEDATILEDKFEGLVVWNSKKPSGGQKTLNYLKERIKEGQSFPLYYSIKGQVQYKATIIDFATSQEELSEKKWEEKTIKHFHDRFEDYKDDNKKAHILFLAESIEKISPKPISDFKFFGNHSKPTQDNLSPIKGIENDEQVIKTESVMTENNSNTPLNQILFGPPGTGKTYNTINKALEIIGLETTGKGRPELKNVFDEKVKNGQIVFTTFHQSMSYEDFVEGIKPLEPANEGDSVIYKVEPGLFKKLCIEASFSIAKLTSSKETAEALDFSKLYDFFVEETQEKLISEKEVELETKSGGTVLVDSISQQGNILVKHPKGSRTYTVSKARLTKLQSSISSLETVSNINDEFREVIGGSNSSAYWAVLNAIKKQTNKAKVSKEEASYLFDDKNEVVKTMPKVDYQKKSIQNFVLIIDEINRGNVSQILGELITLLEADKRLGNYEAIEVTLPYSKEKFGVPPNLYVIGTMNTADRSVEALDTALRRRFSFTEMPPLYDLEGLEYDYAGTTGRQILLTINKRIERLLDRDHLIGHSYLLKKPEEAAEEKLKIAFYENIIPLLQEYFYGDYSKIGAVLGHGFVQKEEDPNNDIFTDGFDIDFAEKEIYQIVDYRDGRPGNQYISPDMNFEEAIKLLVNQNNA